MRLPFSWIKEFVSINKNPAEIARLLTMAGIEVESYETAALPWAGIVVGEVLEAEKHPNADKLTVAKVSDGKEAYQVVCGAPNCRKGIKVAFAPVNASLKDEEGKDFVIKKAKLRGVESSGMLCSGQELKLTSDADGIIELPAEFEVGKPLADYFADTIFDISLTPNLNHCASVMGIARELSALTGLPLRTPEIKVNESNESIEKDVRVSVQDFQACPRYTCRLIKNVKIGPSPDWLRLRLEKCGLRSVNNVVDVTNYVLLEFGHPLHAFDYDQLKGHQIIVKKAHNGQLFQTLDDKDRVLTQEDLMIGDAERSVAIAGVMGGQNSEVEEETQNVLVESAYFDPVTVRKTSKHLGLQTDSSKRFERGTDPNQLIASLDRAAALIQETAGGQISQGIIDVKEKDFPEKTIACRLNYVNRLLGLQLSRGEVETIFDQLHFHHHWNGKDAFNVQVPTYRVDVQAEVDLVEEIARLYGYDNIPRKSAHYETSRLPHTPLYVFENLMRTRLIGEGLQEFLTCDLIGPTLLQIVQDTSIPKDQVIDVLNPTSIEQSVLRTSLMPGLLQVVKYNIDHQNHDIHGFEIGRIHFKENNQYKEPSVAAIVLSGKSGSPHWNMKPHHFDFFDLKGIVENLLKELGIENATFRNLKIETFHSSRQASVFVDSLEVGSFGEVHPAILRRLDVSQRVLFGEFNLQDLMQMVKKKKIHDLPVYPGSERDWTFTVWRTIPYEQIIEYIKQQHSSILESVSLLDIYQNEKLGNDYQNVTLHFVYRDPSKTIEQETVDVEHQRLTTVVLNKLGDAVKS